MNQRVLLGIIGVLVLALGVAIGLLIAPGDDAVTAVGADDAAATSTTSAPTTSAPTSSTSTTRPATTVPTSTTAAAADSTTSSAAPSTSTPASPGASGTIVAGAGVAGWSEGGEWRTLDDGPVPATVGEEFTIVRVGEPVTTATATAVGGGCDFVDPSADVDGLISVDDWPDYPIAVAADWDVVPYGVEVLPNDNETYATAITELLAARGVTDPDPPLRQVIRTDLEGDGVAEILVVAGHDGDFGTVTAGDYSIAVLRKVVEGEVQTAVLGFHTVPEGESGPFLVIYRVAAVADLNGDGRMEIATNDFYYEGGGSVVYDYVNDDLGPWEVLNVGCGV